MTCSCTLPGNGTARGCGYELGLPGACPSDCHPVSRRRPGTRAEAVEPPADPKRAVKARARALGEALEARVQQLDDFGLAWLTTIPPHEDEPRESRCLWCDDAIKGHGPLCARCDRDEHRTTTATTKRRMAGWRGRKLAAFRRRELGLEG